MIAPQIEAAEPLGLELKDFASAVREGTKPVSDTRLGLEIVLGIEALEKSLHGRGEPIPVRSTDEVLVSTPQRA
jgi:hypothetical protein